MHTLTLLSALATGTLAHTWIEQMSVISSNGSFVGAQGYPRGYVARTDPGFNGGSDDYLLPSLASGRTAIDGTDLLCHPSQRTTDQSAKYPRLQVSPGSSVALKYLENGHVTLPWNQPGKPANRGTVYVYLTSSPKADEKLVDVLQWNAAGTGGDKRGSLVATNDYDDGRCHQINSGNISVARQQQFPNPVPGQPGTSMELWCETDVVLPASLAVGSTQTLYWVWDWPYLPGSPGLPDGKQEWYTTCADVDVVASAPQGPVSGTLPQQDPMAQAVQGYKDRKAMFTTPSYFTWGNKSTASSSPEVQSQRIVSTVLTLVATLAPGQATTVLSSPQTLVMGPPAESSAVSTPAVSSVVSTPAVSSAVSTPGMASTGIQTPAMPSPTTLLTLTRSTPLPSFSPLVPPARSSAALSLSAIPPPPGLFIPSASPGVMNTGSAGTPLLPTPMFSTPVGGSVSSTAASLVPATSSAASSSSVTSISSSSAVASPATSSAPNTPSTSQTRHLPPSPVYTPAAPGSSTTEPLSSPIASHTPSSTTTLTMTSTTTPVLYTPSSPSLTPTPTSTTTLTQTSTTTPAAPSIESVAPSSTLPSTPAFTSPSAASSSSTSSVATPSTSSSTPSISSTTTPSTPSSPSPMTQSIPSMTTSTSSASPSNAPIQITPITLASTVPATTNPLPTTAVLSELPSAGAPFEIPALSALTSVGVSGGAHPSMAVASTTY